MSGMGRAVAVIVVVVAVAATAAVIGRGEPARSEAKNAELFAPLKKGTPVSLKEKDGAYEISVGPRVTPGLKVVEVGSDYIAIEDTVGLEQKRIPISAVRVVRVSLIGRRP